MFCTHIDVWYMVLPVGSLVKWKTYSYPVFLSDAHSPPLPMLVLTFCKSIFPTFAHYLRLQNWVLSCVYQTTQLYISDHTAVYTRPHSCIYKTPQLYIPDRTAVYTRPHGCIYQTAQLYIPDWTAVYTNPHSCMYKTTQLYIQDHTAVYTRPHSCIYHTT
jgi:hypothetical protein